MSTRKGWFSYSFDSSLETHATAEEAEGKARRMLASEEEYARKEGEWDDNVTSIFWGQIHGSIVTTKHDAEEDDPPVSYHLRPPDPCTVDPTRPTDNDADHVWLTAEPKDHRITVVKALRAVTDLGLAEAKRIALDGESGFPVCLTGGIHRVGTDVDPKVRLPVEVRTLHRGRKELAATLAALGVPHHVGARPPVPRLPGAAEYEARATSQEDSRSQLCDALGLPGMTWDEALAEVRRRGGSGEQG